MDHVEAVEQIETERARRDMVIQIAIRGRQHAHVDAPADMLAPDRLDLARFEKTQDRALHPDGHLGHFIHEERAVVGLFEESGLVAKRRR